MTCAVKFFGVNSLYHAACINDEEHSKICTAFVESLQSPRFAINCALVYSTQKK